MTYEEMKKDLPETVRRIAAFLKIELTPDEFAEVVRKSGFAYMKKIEKKFETGMIMPWSKPAQRCRLRDIPVRSRSLLD